MGPYPRGLYGVGDLAQWQPQFAEQWNPFEAAMTRECFSCGAGNRDTAKYCKACGQALLPAQASVSALASNRSPLAEMAGADPEVEEAATSHNVFLPTQFQDGDLPRPQNTLLAAVSAPQATKPTPVVPPAATAASRPWSLPEVIPSSESLPEVPALPPPFGLPPNKSPLPNLAGAAEGVLAPYRVSPAAWWLGAAAVALTLAALWAWVGSGGPSKTDQLPTQAARPAQQKVSTAVVPEVPVVSVTAVPALDVVPPVRMPEVRDSSAVTVMTPPSPGAPKLPTKPNTKTPAKPGLAAAPEPVTAPEVATSAAPPLVTAPVLTVQSAPTGPTSPQDACAARGALGRPTCLAEQCAKPAFAQHAQCQRMRKEREQDELQQLYGGS